ncbi:MAG: Smr/MutS family protein [Deltaproteobacteria bacterium]|nr:Smr/MutS family protein [Deltaproteobacteria bacterium]
MASSSFTHKPFQGIKGWFKGRNLPSVLEELSPPARRTLPENLKREGEEQLFLDAVAGVKPLEKEEGNRCIPEAAPVAARQANEDEESLERLARLVKSGTGFVVADTPEYMEGTGYRIHPVVTDRLHRGDFSIQAHVDLHGLNVDDAREVFDAFLKEAIATGKRTVLVIHGRGLSSPSEPVLKNKVKEWLSGCSWRKWIIAYSSARICDGGAGATYILLRQRPITKRFRREEPK